jgi:hypothetical protein
MSVGSDHHESWRERRDATDRMNALLDPDGEPAAVNCRQRHAKHPRRIAFALVRGALGGALGGTRTPNLLIRRYVQVSRKSRFCWSYNTCAQPNAPRITVAATVLPSMAAVNF